MITVTVVEEEDVLAVLREGQLEYYILEKHTQDIVKVSTETAYDHYKRYHPTL